MPVYTIIIYLQEQVNRNLHCIDEELRGIIYTHTGHNQDEGRTDTLEIYDKRSKGFIEVWMTNEEQQQYDCKELTHLLLKGTDPKKCKVVFFLSGKEDLCTSTENLLIANLGCV